MPQISTSSPLNEIVHEAGVKLLALDMCRIVGEAGAADAEALTDDLEAIWQIVDPIIAAIGEYAAENFVGIDKSLFVDQLRDALEGNATHNLRKAAEAIEEDHGDTIAESAREFQMGAA